MRRAKSAIACLILPAILAASGVMAQEVPGQSPKDRPGDPAQDGAKEGEKRNRWEISTFADAYHEHAYNSVSTGLDIVFAPTPDLSFDATLPFEKATDVSFGHGVVEVGAEYTFLHQGEGWRIVNMAVAPRVFLPGRIPTEQLAFQAPISVWRDFGPWTVSFEAAYTLNSGAVSGNRDYWITAARVERNFGGVAAVGLQYATAGTANADVPKLDTVRADATIHIKGPLSLVGAAVIGVNRMSNEFYGGLKFSF